MVSRGKSSKVARSARAVGRFRIGVQLVRRRLEGLV